MKQLRLIILIGLMLFLPACLSPVKREKENAYVINQLPKNIPIRTTRPITLLVLAPQTNDIYNTTKMAYSTQRYQIAYFGYHQWAEPPSQMLQSLMMQTLQKTRYFRAVVSAPYIGRYDYILSTQILELKQNYVELPYSFRLKIRAELSNVITGQAIAIKEFYVTEPLMQQGPYAGVYAANAAVARFLSELADFCIGKLGNR